MLTLRFWVRGGAGVENGLDARDILRGPSGYYVPASETVWHASTVLILRDVVDMSDMLNTCGCIGLLAVGVGYDCVSVAGSEITFKHDDFYDRTWESEWDKFSFENKEDIPNSFNTHEVTVASCHTIDETCSTSRRTAGSSPEVVSRKDRKYDATDTDHYLSPIVEACSEQLKQNPTNPRSTKYNLRHI